MILVIFVMNSALVPWLAPISLPLFLVYWALSSLYRRSSRELKRLENIAETPVYSSFASCMDGLTTIRAFRGAAERLTAQTDAMINDWAACWLKNNLVNRWMGMRLDFIGGGLSGSVGLFCVLWADGFVGDASAHFSAGLVGLMLSFTASLAGMYMYMYICVCVCIGLVLSFTASLAGMLTWMVLSCTRTCTRTRMHVHARVRACVHAYRHAQLDGPRRLGGGAARDVV